MRYIDRTGRTAREPGVSTDIQTIGALTREATKIAEDRGLAVLKTTWGGYKVISECGLGAYGHTMQTLEEVDDYIKHLDEHKNDKLR